MKRLSCLATLCLLLPRSLGDVVDITVTAEGLTEAEFEALQPEIQAIVDECFPSEFSDIPVGGLIPTDALINTNGMHTSSPTVTSSPTTLAPTSSPTETMKPTLMPTNVQTVVDSVLDTNPETQYQTQTDDIYVDDDDDSRRLWEDMPEPLALTHMAPESDRALADPRTHDNEQRRLGSSCPNNCDKKKNKKLCKALGCKCSCGKRRLRGSSSNSRGGSSNSRNNKGRDSSRHDDTLIRDSNGHEIVPIITVQPDINKMLRDLGDVYNCKLFADVQRIKERGRN